MIKPDAAEAVSTGGQLPQRRGTPPQAQCNRVWLLVQATVVELHAVVVQVSRVDQLGVALRWVILPYSMPSITMRCRLQQQHGSTIPGAELATVCQERTDSLKRKTGMCCRMWCFTAVTSVVRTQYFVVERTKPCQADARS